MLAEYFAAGGPVMYAILAAWVVVLAGILDRLLYALSAGWRRPLSGVRERLAAGERAEARQELERERRAAARGLARIDAVSQIATSLGLFGTVLGIAHAFFGRGALAALDAPAAVAAGLATAIFTTVAGLCVFLPAQAFLIVWQEWQAFRERGLEDLLEPEGRG
jgi:biopolymer transport protein ExbB/TolQ